MDRQCTPSLLRTLLLQSTSLPHSPCKRQFPKSTCIFPPRTLCTCLPGPSTLSSPRPPPPISAIFLHRAQSTQRCKRKCKQHHCCYRRSSSYYRNGCCCKACAHRTQGTPLYWWYYNNRLTTVVLHCPLHRLTCTETECLCVLHCQMHACMLCHVVSHHRAIRFANL